MDQLGQLSENSPEYVKEEIRPLPAELPRRLPESESEHSFLQISYEACV